MLENEILGPVALLCFHSTVELLRNLQYLLKLRGFSSFVRINLEK